MAFHGVFAERPLHEQQQTAAAAAEAAAAAAPSSRTAAPLPAEQRVASPGLPACVASAAAAADPLAAVVVSFLRGPLRALI
ncbi:hypothetical protein Esti_006763 [Eimeria stiedai]